MSTFHLRGAVLALSLLGLAQSSPAADAFEQPALLPSVHDKYSAAQVAYRARPVSNYAPAPEPASPSDAPPAVAADYGPSDYDKAMASNWGDYSACGPQGGGCGCQAGWYGYAGGLFMTRDHRNGSPISYDGGTGDAVLTTCDAAMRWSGGFETFVGKYFNCGCNAIEIGYWGLYPQGETVDYWNADTVGGLYTSLNFGNVDYDDGVISGGVQGWIDNAEHHQVHRAFSFHNVELNLLGYTANPCNMNCCGCGPRLNWSWLAGIRYFSFNENFNFRSEEVGTIFDGEADEIYYDVQTRNDLVGFQLGGTIDYAINPCWSIYMNSKFGVYGNHVRQRQEVYGGAGSATVAAGTWAGDAVWVNSSTNDLAFLGQMELGARWRISSHWAARFGYRVVGATGVALTEHQIPNDLSSLGAMSDIDTSGSLLLHGGFAGVEFCW